MNTLGIGEQFELEKTGRIELEGDNSTSQNHVDLDNEQECGKPCPPNASCPNCEIYWDRMRQEGFWRDTKGWTDKAMREWLRA